jgi:hypothetical protein
MIDAEPVERYQCDGAMCIRQLFWSPAPMSRPLFPLLWVLQP